MKLAAVSAASEKPSAATPKEKRTEVQGPPVSKAAPDTQTDGGSVGKPAAKRPRPVETVASGAVAPQPAVRQADWRTYRNQRFGFSLKYPAHLFAAVAGERDK